MEQTSQAIVVADILPTLNNMPRVLEQNRNSLSAASAVIERLIAECSNADKITAEMDANLEKLIIKLNRTDEDMKGRRQPFTQMMDILASEFTQLERDMAKYKDQLQDLRNRRAREVAEAEKKRKAEQARIEAKNKERANIDAIITKLIADCLTNNLITRKENLQKSWNALTLDDFDDRIKKLKRQTAAFPWAMLECGDIVRFDVPIGFIYHTSVEVYELNNELRKNYDYKPFAERYEQEMKEVLQHFFDRVDSKRQELEDAEKRRQEQIRLEKERQDAEEKERELKRQQQEAKNKADRERLEKEQAEATERKKKLEAEQELKRQQEEQEKQARQQREQQEREKLDRERQQAAEANTMQAEMAKANSVANTLFDSAVAAAPLEKGPETRVTWEVEVKDMAGYSLIFAAWFMSDDAKELWAKGAEKFEKMTLERMCKWLGKQYPDFKIDSPLIEYVDNYTAVSRAKRATK